MASDDLPEGFFPTDAQVARLGPPRQQQPNQDQVGPSTEAQYRQPAGFFAPAGGSHLPQLYPLEMVESSFSHVTHHSNVIDLTGDDIDFIHEDGGPVKKRKTSEYLQHANTGTKEHRGQGSRQQVFTFVPIKQEIIEPTPYALHQPGTISSRPSRYADDTSDRYTDDAIKKQEMLHDAVIWEEWVRKLRPVRNKFISDIAKRDAGDGRSRVSKADIEAQKGDPDEVRANNEEIKQRLISIEGEARQMIVEMSDAEDLMSLPPGAVATRAADEQVQQQLPMTEHRDRYQKFPREQPPEPESAHTSMRNLSSEGMVYNDGGKCTGTKSKFGPIIKPEPQGDIDEFGGATTAEEDIAGDGYKILSEGHPLVSGDECVSSGRGDDAEPQENSPGECAKDGKEHGEGVSLSSARYRSNLLARGSSLVFNKLDY